MTDDLTSSISILFAPDQVIEIRAITDDGIASGYFDSIEELAKKVSVLDDVQSVQGIYVTLNEVNPSLLSRRSNRIKMRLSKKDATTADADIIRRRWLPVDIDPVRISGVSSTDEEHQVAIDRAGIIGDFLTEWGFPEPIVADSGNGAHLLYRIDLPNDPASLELVKQCLETLSVLFSDDLANIDTANHNAARIWKLYGTVSRKGDNTKTRPHRRSRVITGPECIEVVSKEQLERLAGALPVAPAAPAAARPKARGQPDTRLVLPAWLADHGIGVANQKDIKGGILYNLDECPFSSAHKDGAYAIQFHDGGLFAACKHASCGGGVQRWDDFREKYEPAVERRTSSKPRPPGGPPPIPSSATAIADIPHYDEAMTVLQHGDPLKAMLGTFSLDHVGDEVPAECLIVSLASRYVDNNNGLHVSVSGESGKGKSDTFNKILLQVPERFRLEGAMSNKALFYMDDLKPGTAIVFDDKLLSEDMQEILKGATSSFRKPINYRTVSQERKSMVCSIPERCIWWIAKVEGSGDDQVFNRMLTCWIDDSPEQDAAVLVEMAKREGEVPENLNITRPEVLTCRAMWEILGRERLHVVIPYSTRVEFQSKANRRNPEMFYSLIKAHALLFSMQRERFPLESGGSYIVATLEDFYAAAILFGQLNGSVGGQETKLTRREAEMLVVISKRGDVEFTIQQLQEATNLSYQSVHRALQGYNCRGQTYSGLLDKCPAISFTDRTVVSEDDTGRSVRRRTHAYQFNFDVYRLWSAGGAVWLRNDDKDGDNNDNPSLTALSATFSTFSATAERVANEDKGAENQNNPCIINKNFNNSTTFSKLEITEHPVPDENFSSSCHCDPGIAESVEDNHSNRPPILKKTQENVANSFSNKLEAAESADNQGGLLKVISLDFKPIGYHENSITCATCGRKGVDYLEKVTPARKSRKDKLAVRICKKCFDSAKRKEQTKGPPLPGIIVLSRMVRISKDIGRCSVCDIGKAVYHDQEAGTRLCQQCYDREKPWAPGSVRGGAGG